MFHVTTPEPFILKFDTIKMIEFVKTEASSSASSRSFFRNPEAEGGLQRQGPNEPESHQHQF